MTKHRKRLESRTNAQHIQAVLHDVRAAQTPPRVRFRRYIRLTLICLRLCNTSYQSVRAAREEFLSVIQVSDDYGAIIDREGLFFDPKDFKANKQDRLPQEAKRLLQMKPAERTDKEIQYLMIILGNIPAFAEYPRRMQYKLCSVGWYESYEPKRAIIREGHPPHSFYFILSGTVLVTAFEDGVARTLVSLQRGMSFGELAVITRSLRQATVSTQTTVELLCISAQDFEDIFMAGGMQNLNDPDHNSFIKSVRFLRDWPVDLLVDNPQACMFHYFNRGQVLVRNSNNSDWIYIVKSGSLSVLKKLKETEADINGKQTDKEGDENKKRDRRRGRAFGTWDLKAGRRRRKRPRQLSTALSEPDLYRNQFEMDKRLEQSLPGYYNTNERLGLIDYDAIIQDHKSRLIQKADSINLPKLVDEDAVRKEEMQEMFKERPRPMTLPPIQRVQDEEKMNREDRETTPISKTARGVYLAHSPLRKSLNRNETDKDSGDGKSSTEPRDGSPEKSKDTRISEELAKLQLQYQRKIFEREGRKTIAEELDNKGQRDFVFTEADLKPMFIMVQVMERGQYFGVSNLVCPDQPSLCLVSNGAECIVLSKKFFLEKANEGVMRHLRQTECPFPRDEELKNNLQDYVNWEAHRATLYRQLLKQKQIQKAKKKQFLPQYQGQYCFRTGPI